MHHEEGYRCGGEGRHADARSQPGIRQKLKVLAIARASRNKTEEQGRQKMKNAYVKLLEIASRVTGQAWKFPRARSSGVSSEATSSVLRKAGKQLDEMIPRVRQVLRQTRERVLRGNTKAEGKLLSIFETHTEVRSARVRRISPMSLANWS